MNAGRLLRQAGFDSEELRQSIAPINPDDVNIWPAARLARLFWRPGIKGVTLWKWVLLHPEMLDVDHRRLGRLVVHELVHLRQFAREGYLRFMARYVRDYWVGRLRGKSPRDAYLAVAAEVEAREVTAHLLGPM